MFFESLIIIGMILLITSIMFFFPELGILGHAWGSDESTERVKSNFKPAAKVFFSVGLVLTVIGTIVTLFFK